MMITYLFKKNSKSSVPKIQIVDEPEPVVASYLGCYKDKKYYPTLEGHKEIFEKNLSPGLCIETCRFKGFSFSGVESG